MAHTPTWDATSASYSFAPPRGLIESRQSHLIRFTVHVNTLIAQHRNMLDQGSLWILVDLNALIPTIYDSALPEPRPALGLGDKNGKNFENFRKN